MADVVRITGIQKFESENGGLGVVFNAVKKSVLSGLEFKDQPYSMGLETLKNAFENKLYDGQGQRFITQAVAELKL